MALHKDLVDYFSHEKNGLLSDAILNIIYGATDQNEYLSAAREVSEANGIAEAFENAWSSYLDRKQHGESTSKERSDKEIEQIIGGSILKAIPTEKRGKEPITIESLAEEYASLGVTVRLNEITHDIEIESSNPNILDHDSLLAITHSYLKGSRSFFTGVTLDNLHIYTSEIAKRNRFNPVLDYLYGIQYDGKDHFESLYDLMGIDSDDPISRALIRKWFYQGIVLLHNSNSKHVAAEGVLTLVGPQGCGKTSLIEKFAIRPEWFARGATLNPNDKDTIRRCCSRWIIELGEVETTLRSDVEALKNFITNDMDIYRPPYGRTDLKYARRSNLAATCNSDRYLLDQSGNRRWWTVPINKMISHSDIEIFPIEQLHAQALADVRIRGNNCFRLTPWEYDALNSRNQKALKPIKAEDEIHDILTTAELYPDDYKFVDITSTDWKSYHDGIKHYSSEIIGRALKKLGVRQKSNGSKRLYSLPVQKYAATFYQQSPKVKDEKSAG